MSEANYTVYAKSLQVGYGNGSKSRVVLENANIELCAGDFAVMVGANGAGKSTLLRTLAGIQVYLGGELKLAGRDPAEMSALELARIVAMVFTERVGAGGLTLREFVSLGRQPHTGFFGRLSNVDRKAVEFAIELCSISSLADKFMAQVSDGERQKAMIARALAQETPIIMLDEPTSFLDVASRIETLTVLSRLARETQRTILLSTHDIAPALRVADSVIVVDKGTAQSYAAKDDESKNTSILSDVLNNIFADRNIFFDSELCDFRAH